MGKVIWPQTASASTSQLHLDIAGGGHPSNAIWIVTLPNVKGLEGSTHTTNKWVYISSVDAKRKPFVFFLCLIYL